MLLVCSEDRVQAVLPSRVAEAKQCRLAYLISACFAWFLEMWVEAGVAVATAVLLADLWQLFHPRPHYNTATTVSV